MDKEGGGCGGQWVRGERARSNKEKIKVERAQRANIWQAPNDLTLDLNVSYFRCRKPEKVEIWDQQSQKKAPMWADNEHEEESCPTAAYRQQAE
ncbi:hypothetical protein J007_04577 [Cryptococcus neoformans]|nr:hypothetical protein C356_04651 [Cryptococcus neoformans var. grubii c45]OXB35710.1 hypothetical protein J007_04577 [Cryptococcus neoformans var. grubii]OXC59842.1 hypothetical protein C358_04694 [Cryptococcus neoformans var. grubii MW-RSA852]